MNITYIVCYFSHLCIDHSKNYVSVISETDEKDGPNSRISKLRVITMKDWCCPGQWYWASFVRNIH